ncbi:MAG: FHA domain-containing protein [Oscillospiraceae bacterium]|nr:FHA domain-containing protein [Oscillospiraceae bacterium]
MKRCRAKPYEGAEPYIFFSYCHDDADVVFPIIEQMARKGYRVWYDDGLNPGDDWPEVIAAHLNHAEGLVVAISDKYASSHNCRNELTLALSKNKSIVSVILNQFKMTPGMDLQLIRTYYLKRFEFANDLAFYEKLFTAPLLGKCQGNPIPLIEIPDVPPEPAKPLKPIDIPKKPDKENNLDETVKDEKKAKPPASEEPEGGTVKAPKVAPAVLLAPSLGKMYPLGKTETFLGRSEKHSNIVFEDEQQYIGRRHAKIFWAEGKPYLSDCNSTNGTFLDGEKINAHEPVRLKNLSEIQLYELKLIFVMGPTAQWIGKTGSARILVGENGTKDIVLKNRELLLRRSDEKKYGCISTDLRVSRNKHARVEVKENGVYVTDLNSSNGTYIDEVQLVPEKEYLLKPDSRLQIGTGETMFRYMELKLN